MGKMIKLKLTHQLHNKQRNNTKTIKPEPPSNLVPKSLEKKPSLPVFIWIARVRRTLRHWYRNFVTLVMFIVTRSLYKVEVNGKENFKYAPSTVIACAHKRDIDISVVIPSLYFMQRPSRFKPLRFLYFPARDDLFERGFLMIYFPWLDCFRFLIRRSSVAFNFRAVQACPVKLPDEQTANQLLNETIRLEGDLPLVESLTAEWIAKLMGQIPPNANLLLSDVVKLAPLSVLEQYATPRMFREPLATRIRERHHRTIISQLRHLTRILDKGGSLFIAPEGRVTPDGRFGKMRAALTRVVLQSHTDLRMLPINLTYDFMDTERPKVIVNIGQEVLRLNHYNKTELSELVRQRVASLATVTMSGIASRWLIEASEDGQEWVRLSELKNETWQQLAQLRKAGVTIENSLKTRQGFEQRLERFINYGFGKGQLFLDAPRTTPLHSAAADSSSDFSPTYDSWLHLNNANLLRTDCNKPNDNPARYSYNELQTLLEALNLGEQPAKPTQLVFDNNSQQRTAG